MYSEIPACHTSNNSFGLLISKSLKVDINKSILFILILCRYETCFFTVKEECGLRIDQLYAKTTCHCSAARKLKNRNQ